MGRPIPVISTEAFEIRLRQKIAATGVPYEAMIELTYGCNLRCVHCYNPTHQAKGELSNTEIKGILDQLAILGSFQLSFTGGEILTRPDAFDILTYATHKGFAITILTNATLITPERAHRLKALRPHAVEISIYGATQATYEQITRVPGSYEQFMKGVRLLRELAVPLVIKMPVMTLNQHEVAQAKQLVEGWGVKFIYTCDIHPRVNGSMEPLAYRLMPGDVVALDKQMLGEMTSESTQEADGRCAAHNTLFSCKCGRSSLAVTPYGHMNLCVALPIPKYDLKTGPVAAGWKKLRTLVDGANNTPGDAYECPTCPVQDHCRQGPVDAWLETGRLEPCLPYFKELATIDQAAAPTNQKSHVSRASREQ